MVGGIIPAFSRGNQGSKNFTETLRSVGKSLEAGFRMSVALREHILTSRELDRNTNSRTHLRPAASESQGGAHRSVV